MSVNDFSGRLLLPSTGRLQRLLSNSASTDCCNIRFSFRMITSGAFRSTNFRSRLLRLIMRRYKSLRSLVAKLPESSRTRGRKSGGMTGTTSRTIHSGLLSLSRIDSTIFSRFVRSLAFCLDPVSLRSFRNCSDNFTRSSAVSSLRIASAPITASKAPSPYCSRAARNSSSVSNCCFSRSVSPASTTT